MYKPRVYTASKVHYHRLWKTLRVDPDWDFVDWTATWVEHSDLENEMAGNAIDNAVYVEAWKQNIQDVRLSDFVLLYTKPTDAIRGTLIEAGCAIGLGIPVLAIGLSADHTWTWHPGVKTFNSLREASLYLYKYTAMVPPSSKRRLTDE
jgi:hypothetical protein